MDLCTHCVVRGDLKRCFETPCTQHEAWMVGELIKAIRSVKNLINESYGVSGLHLNGDVAPWEDILAGGRFEEWLADFDIAAAALRKAGGETAGAITDSMSISDLEPCPFCGGTNTDLQFWRDGDGKTGPGCLDCGATAGSFASWNTRASGTVLTGRLEGLAAKWNRESEKAWARGSVSGSSLARGLDAKELQQVIDETKTRGGVKWN